METKPKVIDLFCGIGGFSKGFEKAGFEIILGIDNWPIALETFKLNHQEAEILSKDVCNIEDKYYSSLKNKAEVIIAGPPCQGFSMSGKRNINDKRNTLFEEVIRAVKLIQPKVVLIENVVGLLSMINPNGQLVKDLIKNRLSELGYETEYKILNASDYGVPQARRRVVFMGSKIGPIKFPIEEEKKVTVGEALSNIPDVSKNKYLAPKNEFQKMMADGEEKIFNHEAMNHNAEVLERIKHVPRGGNWKNIPLKYYNVGGEHSNNYRRLDPDKPSITLKHATKSMIIPPNFNRVITAREVARLQSFPDSFILCGTKFEQHQQLANAVPPLLGYALGKQIKATLKKNE